MTWPRRFTEQDAHFIATAASTDFAALADEVERMEAVRDAAKGLLDRRWQMVGVGLPNEGSYSVHPADAEALLAILAALAAEGFRLEHKDFVGVHKDDLKDLLAAERERIAREERAAIRAALPTPVFEYAGYRGHERLTGTMISVRAVLAILAERDAAVSENREKT
jgi:hypothetical protein